MIRRCSWAVVLLVIAAATACAAPEAFVVRLAGEGFEGLYILRVPDASQPPPNLLGFRSVADWCAPLAAANTVAFLDQVAGVGWARGVSGELAPGELSAYLGHFMATNGEGSEDRLNASSRRPGTLNVDIAPGIMEFAQWPGEAPPGPMHKEQHAWDVEFLSADLGDEALIEAYAATIERGIPGVLCFAFWHPIGATPVTLASVAGDAVSVARSVWGEPVASTADLRKEDPKIPEEAWDPKWGVGHAVTGVGLLKDGERFWVIVHDNWSTTAEDVAVPWAHVVALIRLIPR